MKTAFKWAGQAAALLAVAVVLGLGVNLARSGGIPLVQNWDETVARRAEGRLPNGLSVLDLDRMAQVYQRDDVLVVDARPGVFYRMEHIPGAKSLPLEEAERLIPEIIGGTGPDHRIVTYCSGPTCTDAVTLAEKIMKTGRTDVAVFIGGLEAWQEAAQPVAAERGES